jgi:ribosomal protein S18 acetylase RimI-like enzyme
VTAIDSNALIRPYASADLRATYDICARTAHNGGDARGIYSDDDLMPDFFTAPYLHFEPDLAFVLDIGAEPVGYVVGTADTAAFALRYRQEWIPRLAHKYPEGIGEPTTPDDVMIAVHYNPERMALPEIAAYPAHLHIDLLPEYQRQGQGRALMVTMLAALAAAGADAVHVAMATANTGARVFYDRLGFHEIAVSDPGPITYLGRATSG